jgi:hypothetical protein
MNMQQAGSNIRDFLITESFRFIALIKPLPGILRIALLGSLTQLKTDPKDTNILVTVTNEMDLAALAAAARKLKGLAQSRTKGADVFLADPEGHYIGRICHWRQCGPHFRSSCDAQHCGQRIYLHDDFEDIQLNPQLVKKPPLEVWPEIVVRGMIAGDLLAALDQFHSTHASR